MTMAQNESIYIDSHWVEDSILPRYLQRQIHLPADSEGEMWATLVRKDPKQRTANSIVEHAHRRLRGEPAAVLYVHGWNDHFYRLHCSEFWEMLGVTFYAVDLPKYGRSWHEGQTPGYTENLESYFPALNAARDVIVNEMGKKVSILVIGHSMGGLVTSLWVGKEQPHHVSALLLNSPWLEMQGNRITRIITSPLVNAFGNSAYSKTEIPLNDPGFYGRSLFRKQGGLWDYEEFAQSQAHFVPTAGWMTAIYDGQDAVTKGLNIQIPVLVCTSAK